MSDAEGGLIRGGKSINFRLVGDTIDSLRTVIRQGKKIASHLGRLGEIETVTVSSRTLRTAHTTGPAVSFLGLYFDRDENGGFFEWEAGDGMERFAGIGEDEGGRTTFGASGELTIDGDTEFDLVVTGTEVTIDKLKAGTVEGISEETAVALYVGVVNDGEGTDEIVVEDVSVQRS